MFRKMLVAGLIAASFASVPLASLAQAVIINVAPPAPRHEVMPGPRRGYEWVPGHYEWRNRRYQWVGGYWVRARPGYAYSGPRWVERNGRWSMEQGRWVRGGGRDRDRDGVPNRADRAPNNPNRY